MLAGTYLEQESLVREYGDAYRQFQSRAFHTGLPAFLASGDRKLE